MSKIEWTDTTWNPTTGCTRASSGCDNCYAVTMTKRLEAMGNEKYSGLVNIGKDHFNGVVKCHEDVLLKPLSWRKPKRIFVNSMSDLFHKEVPFEFIDKVFAVMALCPQHTFQILTKRPERAVEYLAQVDVQQFRDMVWINAQRHLKNPESFRCTSEVVQWPLPNVWLGTSCENQETADERIPHLLQCPAAVRFLSCEPLLGEINIDQWLDWDRDNHCKCGDGECNECWQSPSAPIVSWVIAGGESGPNAQPSNVAWHRSLRDQCKTAGVAFFQKQLGKWIEGDDREFLCPARYMTLEGTYYPGYTHNDAQGLGFTFGLSDSHGGNWDEWPEDLRVREFPNEGMGKL